MVRSASSDSAEALDAFSMPIEAFDLVCGDALSAISGRSDNFGG
jgi:hypothetical protein